MKKIRTISTRSAATVLTIGAFGLLSACGSQGNTPETTTPKTTIPATTTTAAKATTTVPTSPALIGLADSNLGKIVVDGQGMSVYLYKNDTKGKPSTCEGQCLQNWPAVIAKDDKPLAGTGLDQTKLTVIARNDGTKQVAYNGWPLYTWIKDTKPGDTTGQNVGNVWYTINSAGDAITK
jgi:predicted lipoprotein with Yx(FWY)xxD motif